MVTIQKVLGLNGSNVGILFLNHFGAAMVATGYLKIEKEWMYLYDKDRSGSGYNFAMYIKRKSEIKKIIRLEKLEDQTFQEVELPNGKTVRYLYKPAFNPVKIEAFLELFEPD